MSDQDLVERILARCEHDQWYGGDLLSPSSRRVAEDDPRRRGFAYPRSTEAQIQKTEAELGVPLPRCYTHSMRSLPMVVLAQGLGCAESLVDMAHLQSRSTSILLMIPLSATMHVVVRRARRERKLNMLCVLCHPCDLTS